MRAIRLYSSIGLLASLASLGFAEITYTVSKGTADDSILVQMEFEAQEGNNVLQIPNWAPGSYRYADYYKGIKNLRILGSDGAAQSVAYNEPSRTWTYIASSKKPVSVQYEAPVAFGAGIGHYSGPATYLYLVGRKEEKCRLKFGFKDTPIAVGLDPVKENLEYIATDYDVLADNPVTFGAFTLDTYTYKGKKHFIAYRGAAASDIDRAKVIAKCEAVTKMECEFFGNVPYNRYVWHFSVNDSVDGAGGLEHLSSTQISLASGVGDRAVSVLAHEFFHLWNVKRIRSKVLGPFDYTTLPQTGALWWLEGVTDYYAHTLLSRYGVWEKSNFYKDILDNVRSVRAKEERMTISPYDSSFRVREAANGRGNSQGLGVSYYNTGWICGLVVDIELLDKTDGRRSLDDVEYALWNLTKDSKPGFEEDEIRKQCVKFGGASLGEFYDRVIMKPGEIPVEAQLEKVGLQIVDVDEKFTQFGYAGRPLLTAGGYSISGTTQSNLTVGDVIVSINGRSIIGKTIRAIATSYREATEKIKPGQTVKLEVKHANGQTTVENIVTTEGSRKVKSIIDMSTVTPRAKKLRDILMAKKR